MAYTSIDNPELYFQTKLYTGNGSTQAITLDGDENMQPDWVWCKSRGETRHHYLADVIRGVKGRLRSDANNAEYTANSTSGFDSFDTDGFTLEADSSELGLNESSHNMVSWNWKAGGSASSNSDGSITSSVSAGSTQGFSVVSFTGTGSAATVGHGLGEVPHWILFKSRSDAYSWVSYQKPSGNNSVLALNITGAHDSGVGSSYFNSTDPTSSVFSLGTAANMNGSSKTFIAYCFAPKKGYSKFGSYTGNGEADGPFIYTGFKPAFVMNKRTDGTMDWHIWDNKRTSFNVIDKLVYPNLTNAEDTLTSLDFLSNGFKIRDNRNFLNASGGTYVYYAFAESPFVNSKGVPNNAR